MENIYLIGFMGTGKSTVAKELSQVLPLRIVEMDEAISTLAAMSIPEIFEKRGEEAFREMETQFLNAISKENNQIISCGGGVVLKDENIDCMKNTGVVILLEARPETILARVEADKNRPLLAEKKSIEQIELMMEKRKTRYERAYEIKISVDEKSPKEIANEIVKSLALSGRLR